jgi:single-strand DNA-binding protein
MNKVLLIGNLTRDPELTKTNNDLSVCRFTVAVSRRFGTNETDFFNIIAWRATADNCAKFLRKGSKVAISGSIQTRSYDANDGTKRYVTEIVAEEVQFLSTRGSNDEEAPMGDIKPVDDSLPF